MLTKMAPRTLDARAHKPPSTGIRPRLRTKPKPAPRVSLDAKMYPHLLDMVIVCAEHRSLVALRAVSRTLRDRCDALLARHLVMAPRHLLPSASPVRVESPPMPPVTRWAAEEWEEWDDPPDALPPSPPSLPPCREEFKVSITSPFGRIPLFRAWQQAIWQDTGAEVDDQPLNMSSKLRAILSLRGTHIIDVVGAIIDPRPALIFQLIGRPITLRLRRDGTGIAPQMASGSALPADFDVVKLYSLVVENVHTAVMFCDLWDTVHPALQHPDVSHPSLTQSKQRLRRVVLNLSFDPDALYIPPDINDAEYPLSVQEVVLVFRAKPGHRPRGAVRAERDEIARYISILFETIGFYLLDMAHTIVNVSDLNPAWGGDDWPALIREKVRRDLALRTSDGGEAPEDILDRQLRFLTLDEFRDEVGEEQFRIETVDELGE